MQLLKMKDEFRAALLSWYHRKKGICLGERPRIHIIYGFPK